MSYQSVHNGSTIDAAVTEHNNLRQIILDTVYPVGSLYTSFNSTSPAVTIGGTWTQIKDCFLVAAGGNYAVGSTGGTTTHTHTSAAHTHTTAGHTLTINEIPNHNHNIYCGYGETMNGTSDAFRYQFWATSSLGWKNFLIQSTGGGASHSHGNTGSTTPAATGSSSNLPPYKAIYMWQRTA